MTDSIVNSKGEKGDEGKEKGALLRDKAIC